MGLRHILLSFLILPLSASADAYTDYIESYSPLAREEMERFGIPASITLAQGLLESAAGRSRLASEVNNHFGIKCHSNWEGPSVLRSDDAPDECFRAYPTAAESFRDHSLFLTRKRYEPLFRLDPTDYAGWARTLRECGYATDPHYAERLIAIIERYSLSDHDRPGATPEEAADFIRGQLVATHRICRHRGLHYIVAFPGDTYLSLAQTLKMDPARLARINDRTDPEQQVVAWQEVYLQEKADDAPETVGATITIGEGETMHSVAQRLGMKLESLRRLNPKAKDRPGERLRLR